MGKHNGKARKTGLSVGKTLENATKQSRQRRQVDQPPNEQSVLEQGNIEDIMAMAEMAGKDFAAEKQKVVVLDTHLASVQTETSPSELLELQYKYRNVVRVPRRPKWTADQSTEDLDRQEKEYFVNWRRELAQLHEQESSLLLTPYEKNLEVWRQLWRVLERSSILVQVVDARDPLLYYSEDLVSYAKELDASTETIVLLNKADLVKNQARTQWADYFDSKGIRYAFWSAKSATGVPEMEDVPDSTVDYRIRIFGVEGIVALLETLCPRTKKRIQQAETGQEEEKQHHTVVGLVGYPNVGKSSTINALFGRKKTPVAATPGRTKHFQTLNVSEELCLCDCPGLVLPAFAKSKAEMVVAGVIPVDRLVDVVSPVGVILSKIGPKQFSQSYGIALRNNSNTWHGEGAVEAIAALALSRGWTQAAGRPDQTRTGRQIIKDFINGVLLHCESPPGYASQSTDAPEDDSTIHALVQESNGESKQGMVVDSMEDALLKECLEDESQKDAKPRRAAHKFHKKPPRTKGNRGRQYNEEGPITSSVYVKGTRGSLTNGMLGNQT